MDWHEEVTIGNAFICEECKGRDRRLRYTRDHRPLLHSERRRDCLGFRRLPLSPAATFAVDGQERLLLPIPGSLPGSFKRDCIACAIPVGLRANSALTCLDRSTGNRLM